MMKQQLQLWKLAAKSFWKRYRKNRAAVIGLIVLIILLSLALLTEYIAPCDPYHMELKADTILRPPSPEHPIGTDAFGRDVFSRVIWGTRISLVAGFTAVIVSTTIGILLGSISGYFGGKVDAIIMRFVDMLLVIPRFFLLLVIVAMFGSSLTLIMVFIGLTIWPSTARLVRAEFLSVKEQDFVMAAKAVGADNWHIVFREILPNAIFPAIIQGSLQVGLAIMMEANLSFLGLGDPRAISWGRLLNDALPYFHRAWWMAFLPGVMIGITVLTFNLVGDGLNDALNPHLKER